jgi:hypothetical protein
MAWRGHSSGIASDDTTFFLFSLGDKCPFLFYMAFPSMVMVGRPQRQGTADDGIVSTWYDYGTWLLTSRTYGRRDTGGAGRHRMACGLTPAMARN